MPKIQITYPTVVFKTIEVDVPEEHVGKYLEAIQSKNPKFVHLPDDSQIRVVSEVESNITIKRVEPDDYFPEWPQQHP